MKVALKKFHLNSHTIEVKVRGAFLLPKCGAALKYGERLVSTCQTISWKSSKVAPRQLDQH